MIRLRSAWVLAGALVVAADSVIVADVLILRDGRRIDGFLTAVRGDTIEFEHRAGREQGRVIRYDRVDVRTLEFEAGSSGTVIERIRVSVIRGGAVSANEQSPWMRGPGGRIPASMCAADRK